MPSGAVFDRRDLERAEEDRTLGESGQHDWTRLITVLALRELSGHDRMLERRASGRGVDAFGARAKCT